jgi:hypothetical protein
MARATSMISHSEVAALRNALGNVRVMLEKRYIPWLWTQGCRERLRIPRRRRKLHLELPGLQRCASICGSVWGSDHGQDEEEKPAPRSQGSAKARAPGRGHASHRAHNTGQAAESAEVQEEVDGAGVELDGGCRTSTKRIRWYGRRYGCGCRPITYRLPYFVKILTEIHR